MGRFNRKVLGLFKAFILIGIIPNLTKSQISKSFRNRMGKSCETLNVARKYFLLDRDSQNCFEFGTRGPCKEMMIFYAHPSTSKHGFCDCDQGFKSELPCKDSPTRKKVYVNQHQRCYSVFSQGPCKQGQWLILEEDGSLKCETNQCLSKGISNPNGNQFWYYDKQRRRCYESFSQGYCLEGSTLELSHDSQYPQCGKKHCFSSLVNGVRSALTCNPGSRYSYFTRACQNTDTRRTFRIG